MTASMHANQGNLPDAELDITVEEDDGVFLNVDVEGGGESYNWVATEREDILEFFRMVDAARENYLRLTS